MKGIVQHVPPCRHCGTPTKPLHKCSKCGKRSILAFFLPTGGKW